MSGDARPVSLTPAEVAALRAAVRAYRDALGDRAPSPELETADGKLRAAVAVERARSRRGSVARRRDEWIRALRQEREGAPAPSAEGPVP